MSGGHFNYAQDALAWELFDCAPDLDYDLENLRKERRLARERNPLDDKDVSEMVYDVLCLIKSYDWYISGDTSEETYRKDVEWFKAKYLRKSNVNA